MPTRTKIDKLTAQAFRGVRDTVCLDFDHGTKSIALFGNNGDGKSCFADAIQWLLEDRIEASRHEGWTREDYRNLDKPDAAPTVALDLRNASMPRLVRELPEQGRSELHPSPDAESLANLLARDNLILRQDALRDFVDRRKTEKLRHLESLLGYDRVGDARDALVQCVNALRNDRTLTGLQAQDTMLWKDLADLGMARLEEPELLRLATTKLRVLGHTEQIPDASNLRQIVDQHSGRLSERERAIDHLAQLEQHLQAAENLASTQAALRQWSARLDEIRRQRKVAEATVLDKLYTSALDALEHQIGDPDKCPLCLQWVDRDALRLRLQQEVARIAEALQSWRDVSREGAEVVEQLTREHQALGHIVSGIEDQWPWLAADSGRLKSVRDLLATQNRVASAGLETLPTSPVEWPDTSTFARLGQRLPDIRAALRQRHDSLAATPGETDRINAVVDLRKLVSTYDRLFPVRREIDAFSSQLRSLEQVLDAIEAAERAALEDLLAAISADVDHLFSELHPGEHVTDIRLLQTEDRGIEFQVSFCAHDVTPPRRALSEAHLNCLGLCLFLALARRIATTGGFIVLDDVVSSIDSHHRRRLARLIRDKLGDFQFLLMTHDDLWFDMLKAELPHGNWKFMETLAWAPEHGVRLRPSPGTKRQEIQRYLDENDVETAGNKTRQLYEMELKGVCEDLGTPVSFRAGRDNDRRTASELLASIATYLRANQTLRDKRAKTLFNEARASLLIANIGSHDQRFEAGGLVPNDVGLALADLDAFLAIFTCAECGSRARRSMDPSVKLAQCDCGALAI